MPILFYRILCKAPDFRNKNIEIIMDIKVITRHTPANYGSLLQSIATIKVFEKLGHTCKIIDYIKSNEYGDKRLHIIIT